MGVWGVNVLQNDDALDFAGKLMDMATVLAKEDEEILALYEMEKVLKVASMETLEKIKYAAIRELDKLDSWKLREDREKVLNEIIDYANERIDSYKKSAVKFDFTVFNKHKDTE